MSKVRLKDIAISQTGPFGSQLHESDYVTKGTPIVTVEHLGETSFNRQNLPLVSDSDKERLSKYILREGDIVFSRVGSVDRCTYVSKNEDGWLFSGRCLRVRVNSKQACPRFISYYFRQRNFKAMMHNISVGATMPSLNTSLMDNIPLYLPKLFDQQHIASVLSVLDDKIELNNKINAELEAMTKTLYDYWFVQFDFPDANGKPYKASGGKMVYNAELKREIPDGWEVKSLAEVCKTYLGGTPSTKNNEYWSGNIPWLNSGEAEFPIISTEQKITQEAINNSATKLLPKGTVLLSITRHLRSNILGIDACVNQSVVGVTETNKLKTPYLYLFITKEIPRLMTLRTGAQQPHINKEIVDDTLIIVPKACVLDSFYSAAQPLFEQIIVNANQNQTLASLRDWLLPMLMNGQVTVKKAYEMVAEKLSVVTENESIIINK